jgi:hypothetical protein
MATTWSRELFFTQNDDVRAVNEKVLAAFPGESTVHLSADTVQDGDDETRRLYLAEFLNSFNASGLPPHSLVLKKFMPII